MVDAATAATGVNAQEGFLLDAADDLVPLVYTDRTGEAHRVILTTLAKVRPFKMGGRVEPVWTLNFVDAWSGINIADAEAAAIAAVASLSIYTEVVPRWDSVRWDFFQWD